MFFSIFCLTAQLLNICLIQSSLCVCNNNWCYLTEDFQSSALPCLSFSPSGPRAFTFDLVGLEAKPSVTVQPFTVNTHWKPDRPDWSEPAEAEKLFRDLRVCCAAFRATQLIFSIFKLFYMTKFILNYIFCRNRLFEYVKYYVWVVCSFICPCSFTVEVFVSFPARLTIHMWAHYLEHADWLWGSSWELIKQINLDSLVFKGSFPQLHLRNIKPACSSSKSSVVCINMSILSKNWSHYAS